MSNGVCVCKCVYIYKHWIVYINWLARYCQYCVLIDVGTHWSWHTYRLTNTTVVDCLVWFLGGPHHHQQSLFLALSLFFSFLSFSFLTKPTMPDLVFDVFLACCTCATSFHQNHFVLIGLWFSLSVPKPLFSHFKASSFGGGVRRQFVCHTVSK